MRLRRIDVVSCGVMLGAFYALLGLVFGAIVSLLSVAGAMNAQNGGIEAIAFGAGAVIIIPLFYGVLGLIGGMVMAVFYNITASIVGGIKLDLVPINSPNDLLDEYK